METRLCPMPLASAGKRSKKHPRCVVPALEPVVAMALRKYNTDRIVESLLVCNASRKGLPEMKQSMHPAAPDHLPGFITAPAI